MAKKKKVYARAPTPTEQVRRDQQQQQSISSVERLLYSRRQSCFALGGISIATILRIENQGLLDKVRLAGSPSGQVFHKIEQVQKLARGDA
jgi:hypothetical protein